MQRMDVTERVREHREAQEAVAEDAAAETALGEDAAAETAAVEAESRYRDARDVVVELQEALLPTDLPTLPQARIAARYLVAEREQAAGGDWFDAVPLAGGRVALVVGDVVAHGVVASAAMGQLRAVLDDALIESGDPSHALARVDRLATRNCAMRAATVCLAVLDPASGQVTYSTRGHPAPMIVAPDGSARHLPSSGGVPLGTGPSNGGAPPGTGQSSGGAPQRTGTASPVSTDMVGPGEMLVLYSDGLIERPGSTLDEGMAALAQVAGAAVRDRPSPSGAAVSAAERVCQLTVEALTRPGYEDDISILAAHRLPEPSVPLQLEVPASSAGLAEVRTSLWSWLSQFEPARCEQQGLDLAVTEVVTNVIEHAYRDIPRSTVRVKAEVEPEGVLQVVVTDAGRWREPVTPVSTDGRGLWVAAAFVDELAIAHGEEVPAGDGTALTLRRRMGRPGKLVSRPAATPPAPDAETELRLHVEEGAPTRVIADGQIDITTADQFAEQLDRNSRGGLHPLSVDLTAVEMLASAGVRVLIERRDRLATHGHELALVAAANTPAQTVLDLVGLSWQVPSERETHKRQSARP